MKKILVFLVVCYAYLITMEQNKKPKLLLPESKPLIKKSPLTLKFLAGVSLLNHCLSKREACTNKDHVNDLPVPSDLKEYLHFIHDNMLYRADHYNPLLDSSLIRAAKENRAEIIPDLVNLGADVHYRLGYFNALTYAIDHEHEAAIIALLEMMKNRRWETNDIFSFCLAAEKGQSYFFKLVMAHMLQIGKDQKNYFMFLSLMEAAEQGQNDIIQILQEMGADLSKKNDNGLTALDIARKRGHAHTVDLLSKY